MTIQGRPQHAAYRLLACDIDNTLVRFPHPPSPRVARAIGAAIDAGVMVALVTGRAFRRARPLPSSWACRRRSSATTAEASAAW